MRALKLVINQRLSADLNYSISSEVVVDGTEEAKNAGREFMAIISAVQKGMAEFSEENPE